MLKLKLLLEQQNKTLSDIQRLIPQFVKSAQAVYDSWDQSNPEEDDLNGGGICQEIAEAISGDCGRHGIEAVTVDSNGMGEQHVWVVARVVEGIFEIDIPYHEYESGGGYTWKKKPNVKFTNHSIHISKMSNDSDWDEISGDSW